MRLSPLHLFLLTLLQAVQLVLEHVGHVGHVGPVVPRSEVGASESQTGLFRPLLVHASTRGTRPPGT